MENKSETYRVIFSGATLIRIDDGENQEYVLGDHVRKNLIHMPSPETKISCSQLGNNFCRDAGNRPLINQNAEFRVKEVNYLEMGKTLIDGRIYHLPIDVFFTRGKPSKLELMDKTFIIDD